ncbi:MAG: eukaryotic-like serine/threonine-protein kinase, partial [Solirubrobacteraceae bacterium]|jgi:serine/threonine-protein kinase|nr:eukaryotic-like serine/threonine-protein kinase [Solirubrobacteraceae bacterium]
VRSAEASRVLQNRGFEVSIQRVVIADVPRDRVANQNPQPGVKAREGSKVTITVSAGPEQIGVPPVVGRSRAEAVAALRSAGLKPVVAQQYSADVPAGRVMSASPPEGTTVDRGTTVRLVVSRGVQPIGVPDVVGRDVAEARGLLEGAGLKVTRRDEVSDKAPGTVIAQDPKAGAKARKGDTVTLTVARGADVPDVVDLPVDEATRQLEAAGFQVRRIDAPTADPAKVGVVLAQAPAAGQQRRRGATVRIRVGAAPTATPTPSPTPTATPSASPTAVP